jgi:hypothetical protein
MSTRVDPVDGDGGRGGERRAGRRPPRMERLRRRQDADPLRSHSGHVCPGIRIHAIDMVQPPGIGISPSADMDAHQTIVRRTC